MGLSALYTSFIGLALMMGAALGPVRDEYARSDSPGYGAKGDIGCWMEDVPEFRTPFVCGIPRSRCRLAAMDD